MFTTNLLGKLSSQNPLNSWEFTQLLNGTRLQQQKGINPCALDINLNSNIKHSVNNELKLCNKSKYASSNTVPNNNLLACAKCCYSKQHSGHHIWPIEDFIQAIKESLDLFEVDNNKQTLLKHKTALDN